MRLFKFVSSIHAVLNMAKGSLKFTPLDELNDPTELTPVMDRTAVRHSLQLLRAQGLTKDQYHWLACQDALLDLLAPQEKVLKVPTTLAQANRMPSIPTFLASTRTNITAAVHITRKKASATALIPHVSGSRTPPKMKRRPVNIQHRGRQWRLAWKPNQNKADLDLARGAGCCCGVACGTDR